MTTPTTPLSRCQWAASVLAIAYHDLEWGTPVHDDRTLFEFLILEGAQAGLSWETILKKRVHYRQAMDNFDPALVTTYTEPKIDQLMADPGIIRNRRKILSAVRNAQAFLEIQKEFGSFDAYVWQFTGGRPIQNSWTHLGEIPARTADSDRVSKDLIRRGFSFVGSTICYAFMQAVGMVNDHLVSCFRYPALRGED
jgi:DNA-3-methyladenine glycosylase I